MKVSERMDNVRTLLADELSVMVFDIRRRFLEQKIQPSVSELFDACEGVFSTKEEILGAYEKFIDPAYEKWVYGAGAGCEALYKHFHELYWNGVVGIIDNYVNGERFGLPTLTFTEFLKMHGDALVINSLGLPVGEEISRQCREAGIKVLNCFDTARIPYQYFDLPAKLGLVSEAEVFVQAGCFDGATQKNYIRWFGPRYEKMVTFEPNPIEFRKCKEQLKQFSNIELVQAGLSNMAGVGRIKMNGPESRVYSDGEKEIRLVSLDEYFSGSKVTFIALDVEGFEYKALCGAERIIREQKPKLAISIYHRPEDMYQLPELIQSIRPDYQFYLRHYDLLKIDELILYAF